MTKSLRFQLNLLILWTQFLANAAFAEAVHAPTTKELVEKIAALSQEVTPRETILATDLDNTLLQLDRDLGSEHWFLWQKSLIESGRLAEAVTDSVTKLLKLQTLISGLASSHLVDETLRPLYSNLQAQGAHIIGLTSRSIDTRDVTLREISRQGLNFGVNALMLDLSGSRVIDGAGSIFNSDRPEQSGLTAQILAQQRVTAARPVAYTGGVLFTEGQNKGVMLASYLYRSQATAVKAIIFIDDRIHHVQAVDQVLTALYPQAKVIAIHYQQSRPDVVKFEESDKRDAINDYCVFIRAVEQLWRQDTEKYWSDPQTICQ